MVTYNTPLDCIYALQYIHYTMSLLFKIVVAYIMFEKCNFGIVF